MRVTIDGTEYVAVTAKRITVDGVVYAALPGGAKKIIDSDDDVWVPASDDLRMPQHYRCLAQSSLENRTRNEIEQYWGITREEF